MSSPKTRQGPRRGRAQLLGAHKDLTNCVADLLSYDRVLADMAKRGLSPFGGAQALAIVRVCRDATARDCERFKKVLAKLEKKAPSSDPKETMRP